MKVKCCDCKYNGGMYNIFEVWRFCGYFWAGVDKWEEKFGGRDGCCVVYKHELNFDEYVGYCKYYQRKWWKFWVNK